MESLPPVPPPVEPVTPAWPPSPQVDRFVASLVHGGAFHASVAPVDGMPFVQLVEHGLDRAAVVRWAAAITRFAQGRGEVITARATQTAVVLATGSPPFLVAARRPGIPAGYLEMRAARAVDGLNGAVATSPPPRRGLEARVVGLHQPVRMKLNGQLVVTTAGRVLFNEIVPTALGYVNSNLDRKSIESLVGDCFSRIGADRTIDPDLVAVLTPWFAEREELFRAAGAIGERPSDPRSTDDPQARLLIAFGRDPDWSP